MKGKRVVAKRVNLQHENLELWLRKVRARWMEPKVGVEPTTCRLRIGCSTTELPRQTLINSGDLRSQPREFRPYFVQKFPNTP